MIDILCDWRKNILKANDKQYRNIDILCDWRKNLLKEKEKANEKQYRNIDILCEWRKNLLKEKEKQENNKKFSISYWRNRKNKNKLDYLKGLDYLGISISSNMIFPPNATESLEYKELMYKSALIGQLMRRGSLRANKLGKVYGKPKKYGIYMKFIEYIQMNSNLFKLDTDNNPIISLVNLKI